MSEHTPGPWIQRKQRDGHISIVNDDISYIATVNALVDEHESNAALIAAAPELLEALEQIHTEATYNQGLQDDPIMKGIAKLASAAIAKAKGKP